MAKVSATKMPMIGPVIPTAPMARIPHPVHVGRDTRGRMMPGNLMKNAAPPFKARKTAPKRMIAPPPAKGW